MSATTQNRQEVSTRAWVLVIADAILTVFTVMMGPYVAVPLAVVNFAAGILTPAPIKKYLLMLGVVGLVFQVLLWLFVMPAGTPTPV